MERIRTFWNGRSKGVRLLIILALLICVLALCIALIGATTGVFRMGSSGASAANGYFFDYDAPQSYDMSWDTDEAEEAYGYGTSGFFKAYSASETAAAEDYAEEKEVYRADVTIETKEIKGAIEELRRLIAENGGKIQQEQLENMERAWQEDYYGSPNAYFLVRVPQGKLDGLLSGMEGGEGLYLRNVSRSGENMTKEYYDTQARLRALRVQEERLLEFMASASSVSEMLEVEARLSDVQYQIDSFESRIKTIDYDVDYSQVSIYLSEVVHYTPAGTGAAFGERLAGYFRESGENFLYAAEAFMEFVIMAAPYIVVLVVLGLIVRALLKRRARRNPSASLRSAPPLSGEASKED